MSDDAGRNKKRDDQKFAEHFSKDREFGESVAGVEALEPKRYGDGREKRL